MLPGLVLVAASSALVAAVAFGAGWKLEHDLAAGRYAKLELSYAEAKEKAIEAARQEQRRYDDIATEAARREASAQAKEASTARRRLLEVQKHVKDNSACISWGFVRVLDAATHGVLADNLPLAPRKSDDACSGFTASQLARSVSDNYAQARGNAIQLDALITFIRDAKASKK